MAQGEHTTHDMHVKVKEQLAEVHAQLQCEFQKLNLSYQAWQQASLLIEPSHWPDQEF